MFVAYVVVTLVTIAVNVWAAVADFSRAGFVLANSAELGIPRSWLPPLATLKAAGAAGLLLGLLGVRFIGVAAAVGLTLFFAGAVAAHVRARVFHNMAFPGGFLLLAVASLALALAR
ncbi:DoxX family protein [Streptosporangium sp. V21-05]|uniref:DoxX family protein n=1 Tax=Streptosporangium sp. V21-05 TaxID=3446115 RepID=UPI003F52B20D